MFKSFIKLYIVVILSVVTIFLPQRIYGQRDFMIMQWNVENLFDTQPDTIYDDKEFLPTSIRHWTLSKYIEKQNKIAKTILSIAATDSTIWKLPDIIGLCEIENDTTLRDLTQRSALAKAKYKYIATSSSDYRGIDVALLYSPFTFLPIGIDTLAIKPIKGMKPTRDILCVAGERVNGDTLHIFLLHSPSRSGGEFYTRKFRMHVAKHICEALDSIRKIEPLAKIIIMGDFNDHSEDAALQLIESHGMVNISAKAVGKNGAKATYKHEGRWKSLDHILVSNNLCASILSVSVYDPLFILEDDIKYGGLKPFRTYNGMRYNRGYSDHLPLLLRMK